MDHDLARIRAIFDELIETPKEQRAALLAERCAGDEALRRRVEALIATAEGYDRFLSEPTREKPAGSASTLGTTPLSERPGTRIGPYKLLQIIGEGGFGVVFMAEQERPIRRRVALKIIKLGMDTRQVVARFEAERQALALMDHPNIARVFDGGATDAGRPYFVMEYVKGDPITEFADAHRLNLADRLALFAQVCSAVQHAHTKGIIHRDLKPRNVLVNMTDGRPFARVIDFGIAKATGASLTDKTLFTEHRQLVGTPEYMSPEQAEGSPDIDTRTDVYALGVLLYELLTGATPFDAARLRSAAFAEMQRIIKEEEPPLPSVRLSRSLATLVATAAARQAEPGKLGTQIRGELDWIVMKALDKDRARRYESASQLAADVQRHLSGEPVVAAPPSAVYRLRKFVRKHKQSVIAGGAVTAALVLGIAGMAWQWQRATTANVELRRQNETARTTMRHVLAAIDEDNTVRGLPLSDGSYAFTHHGTLESGRQGQGEMFVAPSDLEIDLEGKITQPQQPVETGKIIEALGLAVEQAVGSLSEQVKRARLAEAQIIYDAFAGQDAAGADEEFLASLDLTGAVATRTEFLGKDHAETIKAEMLLWQSGRYGEMYSQVDGGEYLDKLVEWNERRATSRDLIRGVDIDLWTNLAIAHWDRKELPACLNFIHRIGKHSPEAWSHDPRGIRTIIYPWPPNSPTMVVALWGTAQERAAQASALEQLTLASLYRSWAFQSGPDDPVTALEKAESLDAEAGVSPHPANLAIRAFILAGIGDGPEGATEAATYLEQAISMMKDPPWVEDAITKRIIEVVEERIRPAPTPEQQLAEETKRRRLAEARIVIDAFAHRDAGGGDDDILASLDLRSAVATLMEYLGGASAETIKADMLLIQNEYREGRLSEEDVYKVLSEKAIEWNQRREASGDRLRAIDIELWSRLALASWKARNLATCLEFIHRIGLHLQEATAEEQPGRLSIFLLSYYGDDGEEHVGIQSISIDRNNEGVLRLAKLLQEVTLSSLHRALALQSKDLTELVTAEFLDAAKGESPNPANLAVRSILGKTINEASAREHLSQAVSLLDDPKWAENGEVIQLISLAERTVGSLWIRGARQLGNLDTRAAERGSAEEYVAALLAGPLAIEELAPLIRADESASLLRRFVRLVALAEQLRMIDAQSQESFNALRRKEVTTARMRTAAERRTDLPRRVRERLLRSIETWRFTEAYADDLNNISWPIVLDSDSPQGDFAQALALAEEASRRETFDDRTLTTLGAALYRTNRFNEALLTLNLMDSLRHGNPEISALIAMCQFQLGEVEEARLILSDLHKSEYGLNSLAGQVVEGKLVFSYVIRSSWAESRGEGWFELSSDGNSLVGQWQRAGADSWREWIGKRVSEPGPNRFEGLWSTSAGDMWLSLSNERIIGVFGFSPVVREAVMLVEGGSAPSSFPHPASAKWEIRQWASEVIGFSSQYGTSGYAATQALGRPNTVKYGDWQSAWAAKGMDDGVEFVSVGFESPVYATGLTVRETYGNGFVCQIDIIDLDGTLHTVWQEVDPSLPGSPVDFFIEFDQTPYLVKGVKIHVDARREKGWEEIDAVMLHGVLPDANVDSDNTETEDE